MKIKYHKKIVTVIIVFIVAVSMALIADDMTLIAPDGSMVVIHRDSYGVPHITGETETGVFFGQGFAVAEDRLWQMEITRRAAEGKLAEWFPSRVDDDTVTRRMYYTQQERMQQFANLSPELQTVFTAYTAGINTYLDSMAANPARYRPYEFNFFGFSMERWTVYKSVAVAHFLIRRFGQFGGEELMRLWELQTYGWEWFNENRPINDPNAPTTIPGSDAALITNWHYSDMTVPPEVVKAIEEEKERIEAARRSLGIPLKFGSFAVQIAPGKSSNGDVMLLGCPQMGTPMQNEPNVTHEVELHCPTFHVGGMIVAGVPLVAIGHTENHAWTITSGNTDNSDVYIDSTLDASYSSYYYNGQWLNFDTFVDTIQVAGGSPVVYTHYRTVHGPVFWDSLAIHQVYALKMSFWDEELNMLESLYGVIKANNLAEFETALQINPMSFNMFYIGKDQNIKFWHIGKYQDRSDGVDPRLPHKGDGSEEWGGFIPFADLPVAANPTQNYFVNWNNKPVSWWNNGDNCPWHGNTTITLRVLQIDNYVGPISSFGYQHLKNVPHAINDHGSYQQAIEMSTTAIIDSNIVPPGQSGFIDINGVPSPHFSDQWPLHVNWEFKDQLFGVYPLPTGIQLVNEIVPERVALHQNYPNPFNPSTTIEFALPQADFVTLKIYNILGEEVATLVSERLIAGEYKSEWDASRLASGVYLYKLEAGDYVNVKKMVLLR